MNKEPRKGPVSEDRIIQTPEMATAAALTRIAVALESIAESLKATEENPYRTQ
jgi:hypothetical protein